MQFTEAELTSALAVSSESGLRLDEVLGYRALFVLAVVRQQKHNALDVWVNQYMRGQEWRIDRWRQAEITIEAQRCAPFLGLSADEAESVLQVALPIADRQDHDRPVSMLATQLAIGRSAAKWLLRECRTIGTGNELEGDLPDAWLPVRGDGETGTQPRRSRPRRSNGLLGSRRGGRRDARGAVRQQAAVVDQYVVTAGVPTVTTVEQPTGAHSTQAALEDLLGLPSDVVAMLGELVDYWVGDDVAAAPEVAIMAVDLDISVLVAQQLADLWHGSRQGQVMPTEPPAGWSPRQTAERIRQAALELQDRRVGAAAV